MKHNRIADRDDSILLVIDMQESYRGKLYEEERTVEGIARLIDAAKILGIPVVATEQYPERLGATREEVASHFPEDRWLFAKRSFSGLSAPGLSEQLGELDRSQLVLAGIETHVCVGQTSHDLLLAGYHVHAVRDAITSRFELEASTGYSKLTSSGAVPACVEGILFEWVRDSRAPEFKAIHQLVR